MKAAIPAAEEVIDWAAGFSQRHALEERQRSLLQIAFAGFRAQLDEIDPHPCFYLPALVATSVNPASEDSLPIAAVATMVYLGVDIFDDVADSDLPAHWNGYRPAEINLVAATLFSALPARAIAESFPAPEKSAALQQILAEGLLVMAAGQHADIQWRGASDPRPTEIETSLAGKSGAELSMFARLAATAAGAEPKTTETYGKMGRAFGTASQLSSDCYDLFEAKWSKDLANASRTLPIALHLSHLSELERSAFLELLTQAEHEPEAQRLVREQLRAAGALRRCALLIEVECQRALRELENARPHEPAGGELRSRILRASLFPRVKN